MSDNNYPEGDYICLSRWTLRTMFKNCEGSEILNALQCVAEGGDGSTLGRRTKLVFDCILKDNEEFETD